MNRDEAHVFFAEARLDPFLHYATMLSVDSWVDGYRSALVAHGAPLEDYDRTRERAIEQMKIEEARKLVAMAEIMQRTVPKVRL